VHGRLRGGGGCPRCGRLLDYRRVGPRFAICKRHDAVAVGGRGVGVVLGDVGRLLGHPPRGEEGIEAGVAPGLHLAELHLGPRIHGDGAHKAAWTERDVRRGAERDAVEVRMGCGRAAGWGGMRLAAQTCSMRGGGRGSGRRRRREEAEGRKGVE
jgi:hypothetical protein